mmetsp:Transcript_30044/g.62782  ORF Transcript_30044/g.62782 Transcript_30044/m.62782 type:complete len:228 (-) Transcript_30044:475-1158(-)
MTMVATEWSSSAFSEAAVGALGVAGGGGAGASGSRIFWSVAGSPSLGISMTFLGLLDGVTGVAIARSKSFSNEKTSLSDSSFAFSASARSALRESTCLRRSVLEMRSLTRSVSARRSLETSTASKSPSSGPPAISGSLSVSTSSALYSRRFKIRSSLLMLSTRDWLGASASWESSASMVSFAVAIARSKSPILRWLVFFSSESCSSFILNSSRSKLAVSESSATSAS